MHKTRIFSNIFRFIDDNNKCVFNNDEFKNNYSHIYTDQLQLKKENKDHCETSFGPFNRGPQQKSMKSMIENLPLSYLIKARRFK